MTVWNYRVFSADGFWCYAKDEEEARRVCASGTFRYEVIAPIRVQPSARGERA